MTLKELQEKNAAYRARKEAEAKAKAEEEAKKQEEAKPKKKGKKPANRAYLVVEPAEEAIEEEKAEENKEEE